MTIAAEFIKKTTLMNRKRKYILGRGMMPERTYNKWLRRRRSCYCQGPRSQVLSQRGKSAKELSMKQLPPEEENQPKNWAWSNLHVDRAIVGIWDDNSCLVSVALLTHFLPIPPHFVVPELLSFELANSTVPLISNRIFFFLLGKKSTSTASIWIQGE